jgi:hypothetical protein
MTEEEATEIRQHLIDQLNINGFGTVVSEINIRVEEDYEEKDFVRSPRFLLKYFLTESIDILGNLSNDKYAKLIGRFNEYNKSGNLEGISVELISEGETKYYDLRDLPSYMKIITALEEIRNELSNEM